MTDGLSPLTTFKKWRFGDIVVTRVLEMAPLTLSPETQLRTTRDVVLAEPWLQPNFATPDGQIRGHIQAFVIEAGGKVILVDPCVGNHKPREIKLFNMLDNPFLDRLAAAGFPSEKIDVVLCTHLHVDHCGWNTKLVNGKWVPSFPNAEYLFSSIEYEFTQRDDKEPGPDAAYDESYLDSIKPVVDAGLAKIVEFDHHIVEGVYLEPTPGHSPGHCSIVIRSGGEEALITGDVAHHPIQVCRPEICSTIDWDEAMSTKTRRHVFSKYAGTGRVVLGTHFADPTSVTIVAHGDTWRVEGA